MVCSALLCALLLSMLIIGVCAHVRVSVGAHVCAGLSGNVCLLQHCTSLYTRCGLVGGIGVCFYGNTEIYTNVLAPSRPHKLRLPVPHLQWSVINIQFIPSLRCLLLINRHLPFAALWAPRSSSAVPIPSTALIVGDLGEAP